MVGSGTDQSPGSAGWLRVTQSREEPRGPEAAWPALAQPSPLTRLSGRLALRVLCCSTRAGWQCGPFPVLLGLLFTLFRALTSLETNFKKCVAL